MTQTSGELTVVKLGGSLAGSEHLTGWLDAMAACRGQVVVVPGGGQFADTVRAAQETMRFDDVAAHAMALLAMEQFGWAMVGLRRAFRVAASVAAIRRILHDGYVPVWAPTAMVLREPTIPASWDVTSDSLAVWLAGRLGARRLLLVKHGAPADPVLVTDLVVQSLVDPDFPRYLANCGARAFIAAPQAHAAMTAAIRRGGPLGARIELHAADPTDSDSSSWPRSRRRAGAGL